MCLTGIMSGSMRGSTSTRERRAPVRRRGARLQGSERNDPMEESTAEHRRRKFALSTVELLLLATIVIAAAFMVRVLFAPVNRTDRNLTDSVAHLELRVYELSTRLNALQSFEEGTGSAETAAAPDLPPPDPLERLMRLEERVQALERRLGGQGRAPKSPKGSTKTK